MDGPANAFALAVVLAWGWLFLRSVRGLSRRVRVEASPSLSAAPKVTVFVPARNEESVIARSIAALLGSAQGGLLARAVVIDDGSTDGTRAALAPLVAAHPELSVLDGRGPGPGECGKPAALRDAVAAIEPSLSSEWLLFLDADVVLAPGAIGGLLAAAEQNGADLVSGFPQVELGSLVDHLLMPAIGAVIVARHPPDRVADPSSPIAFANGQLILIRKSTYLGVGGHGAVVGEILEDSRLAQRVKAAGGRLLLVDARAIARTRMYEGLHELVEGWSKNLFLLMDRSVRVTLSWAIGSVLLGWSGLIALLVAGYPFGLLAYLLVLTMQATLRKGGGASPLWAVSAPFGALGLAALLLRSMRLHRGHQAIAWKGRLYGG